MTGKLLTNIPKILIVLTVLTIPAGSALADIVADTLKTVVATKVTSEIRIDGTLD